MAISSSPRPDPPGGHTGAGASLVLRLAGALGLLILAGGAGVTFAAFDYGRRAAQEAYDRLLVGAANQIAGAVSLMDGAVVVDLPASAFELLALAPEDRILYAVIDPAGRVVTGYDTIPLPDPGTRFATVPVGGEPFRLAVVERTFAERAFAGTVRVVVGQTLRARQELASQITRNAMGVLAAAALAMAALTVFAVRSSLAPLRTIERALAARSPQDLSPLDVPVPREVGGLVASLSHFMGRLDRQIEGMRSLIADASHQLRTPIAALRAQAELAADETDPARQREIIARIRSRSVNLGRLADQLLSHAMIIHRAEAVPRARIDLREVAIRAVDESDHDLLASDAVLRLDLPEDSVEVAGDTFSLVEACKNLVTNAFRHGRPPVTVAVWVEDGAPRIGVRDVGPGMPREHWENAPVRYGRQSGVSPDSAGLGLVIVDAVARAHGGRLRFRCTDDKAFEAALILPAAPGVPGTERHTPD